MFYFYLCTAGDTDRSVKETKTSQYGCIPECQMGWNQLFADLYLIITSAGLLTGHLFSTNYN